MSDGKVRCSWLTAAVPYSLSLAFLIAAVMQRLAARSLQQKKLDYEAKFSFYCAYICFFAALAALAAGAISA